MIKNKLYYIDNCQVKPSFLPNEINFYTPNNFLNNDNITTNDTLIVLCETCVDYKNEPVKRSGFHGIQFVQELRRRNIRNPVLFVSFLNRVLLTQYPEHKIINTVGHDFIQLPFNQMEWLKTANSVKALTQESLMVCKSSFCNNHGLINYLTHSIRSYKQPTVSFKNNLINTLKDIAGLYKLIPPLEDFNKEFGKLDNSNMEESINYVENYGELVKSKTLDGEPQHQLKAKLYENYEILWLDDEASEQDLLFTALSKLGVKIHLCDKVNKAIEIIQNDNYRRPKIMLAIVDYILLKHKDGVNVQQNDQGFEFIKWVSVNKIPIKLLALSSMHGILQTNLAELYGISVRTISKKAIDLNSVSGVNYILEEAVKLANDNWMQLNRKPTGVSWEKHLLPSYLQIIQNKNCNKIESEISRTALDWISKYNSTKQNPRTIKFISSHYSPKSKDTFNYGTNSDKFYINLLKIIKASEKLKNPTKTLKILLADFSIRLEEKLVHTNVNIRKNKSQLKDLKKEIRSIKSKMLEQLKAEFKKIEIEFILSPKELDTFNKYIKENIIPTIGIIRHNVGELEFTNKNQFKNYIELKPINIESAIHVFAGRRVLLYLAILKQLQLNEVGGVLGFSDSLIRQVFSTWAAIKTEDFPLGITIEEEVWLIRNFQKELSASGIELKKDINFYYSSISRISKLFKNYFNSSKLKSNIEDRCLPTDNGTIIYFNDNFTPEIHSTQEIKILINFIVDNLDIQDQKEFYTFIILWRSLLNFILSIMYTKAYDPIFEKEMKVKSKQKMGKLFSLRHYLLNIKPKQFTSTLIELNSRSYSNNIEDEYILLHSPIDHYFNEATRTKSNFYDFSKPIHKIYQACFSKNNNDIELIANFRSSLFYKAKSLAFFSGKSEQDLEIYNIHPFFNISKISVKSKFDRNKQVYKEICSAKRKMSQRIKELHSVRDLKNNSYYESERMQTTNRETNPENVEYEFNKWELIPENIKEFLYKSIENFDENFTGVEEIYESITSNIDLSKIPSTIDLSQFSKIIVIKSRDFDNHYILKDHVVNLSAVSSIVVLGIE